MKFYNRKKELVVLQSALDNRSSGMIVISGRRRVGKSRLVDEFLKKTESLKIVIVPKEEKQVASDFADMFYPITVIGSGPLIWTSTFVVYEAPDKPFGKTVEWEGNTFEIPKQFQGKENIALVCDHHDFDSKNKFATSDKFRAVPFPRKDGWYALEPNFGLPAGASMDSKNPNARYLRRRQSAYIGSAARRLNEPRVVDLTPEPTTRGGAFIVPQGDKPKFDRVKEALEYFFINAKERILYIDEFPNLHEVNPSITYELQSLWEKYKEKTDKILIFSGSYVSMMDKIFTRQKAPLFNRATFKIILQPLTPEVIWAMQNDIGVRNPEQKIVNYCIFGGVPYYYEVLERYGDIPNVESLFFDIGQLREEGQDILRQEFGSAYKKYFSILEAIGAGLVSAGEIANKLGIRQTTLSKYVQSLQNDFKLIERHVPFDQSQYRSKKGTYMIKDNLLAFWFSHVYGKTQAPDKENLSMFVGKRFEFLCSNFLVDFLSGQERIIKVGRWWGQVEVEKGQFEQREIDLIVETDKTVYIGECKWSENKIGEKELAHLKVSARALKTKKPAKWVLFSKKGFSIRESKEVLLFDAERIVKGA